MSCLTTNWQTSTKAHQGVKRCNSLSEPQCTGPASMLTTSGHAPFAHSTRWLSQSNWCYPKMYLMACGRTLQLTISTIREKTTYWFVKPPASTPLHTECSWRWPLKQKLQRSNFPVWTHQKTPHQQLTALFIWRGCPIPAETPDQACNILPTLLPNWLDSSRGRSE